MIEDLYQIFLLVSFKEINASLNYQSINCVKRKYIKTYLSDY